MTHQISQLHFNGNTTFTPRVVQALRYAQSDACNQINGGNDGIVTGEKFVVALAEATKHSPSSLSHILDPAGMQSALIREKLGIVPNSSSIEFKDDGEPIPYEKLDDILVDHFTSYVLFRVGQMHPFGVAAIGPRETISSLAANIYYAGSPAKIKAIDDLFASSGLATTDAFVKRTKEVGFDLQNIPIGTGYMFPKNALERGRDLSS